MKKTTTEQIAMAITRSQFIKVTAVFIMVASTITVAWMQFKPAATPNSNPLTISAAMAVGGPFTLIDHNGETVTNANFHGKFMLILFGYTFCPDVCPTGLSVMAEALDMLGAEAERVTPVYITVDPARDTVEQLKEYVPNFHPRLVGLTGTDQQIKAVARAYRVYYAKVKNGDLPGDYTVDHSSFFYFMDGKGTVIKHFRHSIGADELAERLAMEL